MPASLSRSTYLSRIAAFHRERAAADDRPLRELLATAATAPSVRSFTGAIRSGERPAVIAEIKRRSPSKGPLAPDVDAAAVAEAYAAGGATCLSVLTDNAHFGGCPDDLIAARTAVRLPLLRKDFTVSAADVVDARVMGADAVLLIVAILSDDELRSFGALARDLGMAALVEVHDEAELDRAVDSGADLVGVNQRDLTTFAVDTERAERVGARIPKGIVRVAESGLRDAADVRRAGAAGFDAVLVGESLVTASDPAAAVRALRGV